MDNPFSFSGVVKAQAFCNREQERSDLKRYIRGSQNVLMFSHRRYGKTSLILKVFDEIKDTTPIYVDLYGSTTIEDFLAAVIKGISAVEAKINKLVKLLRDKIRSLTFNWTIDPVTGSHVAIPIFAQGDQRHTIDEVFALIESLSKKKKVAVAFDEFQEIAKYGDDTFEKQLRKSIQHHNRISYIFAGSQKHILSEIFVDSKRAFYKLATSYPIKKIATEHYVKWVESLYLMDNRKMDSQYIETVVDRCKNHPMYIQEYFFHLWESAACSIELIDRTEGTILNKRENEFSYAWESFTLNQMRALKLVANTQGKNIFAADTLSKFGFKTASQLVVALKTLMKREFVKKNNTYSIQDPLFELWVKQL